jgi:MFS transporter, DHA1 family, inner membrane transport protein
MAIAQENDMDSPAASATSPREIDRPWTVFTLLVVASVTEAMFLLLPSFIGALDDVLRLTPERTGLVGSADLAGIALATATGPWWLRRVSWRRMVLISLGTFLVVNALCLGVVSFPILLGLRILAGIAAGTAYAVALAGIVDTRDVARNTALLVFLQVVFSAVGVYALDAVRISWRLDAVYIYILAWTIPGLALCWRWFPENPGDRVQAAGVQWRRIAAPGAAVLIGTGFYFLMIGGVWGYLEGIARAAGLTLGETGAALSIGLVVSLVGPAVAAWLGLRLGRTLPLIVTAIAQIASLYLLIQLKHFGNAVLAFYIINTVFQLFWNYIIAYFITIFNDIDESGRFVALYGMAAHLTLAIGPYLGAFLIQDGGYAALLWFGIGAVVICFGSFLLAARLILRAKTTEVRCE